MDGKEQEQKHKRRVRYQGTHPKNFKEKYKELNPEKHADTIAKILEKGKTPAGMHIPICVQEILDFLQIKPGQIGLDATLGYGGHTSAMLKCLEQEGHLYALDVDPIESKKTKERLKNLGYDSDILTIYNLNFCKIDKLGKQGILFDFVLADLGVSSMQIDNPDRGFSFKKEGPLDLRLNPEKGITAAELLQTISKKELEALLIENSDEPYAAEIARTIVSQRKRGKTISTTTELRQIVGEALVIVPLSQRKEAVKKSCQRTFQALRIEVNHEFDVLTEFLEKLPHLLNKGGRVAILTFHSGEDRLVKQSFKDLLREGVYSEVARRVIRPSIEECNRNSRASSAKLRWAIKSSGELNE
ncbi:16S rRNA (cytosine(1402)-N(4))-methyltransferase RsmH [Scatolibacter rhodanostii]|uniref:16S rRNA (cytosine(1402)-N(4))-methyltransferase RsmH n=1 Tax=Scatolibacter rhodanostii TaxID=2014781 RepID=UPI000C07F294|nr:16S rRNA (cytosine(1402)-N(4))-methyltransferase RsmH [Scatolibacter rhodanostii]